MIPVRLLTSCAVAAAVTLSAAGRPSVARSREEPPASCRSGRRAFPGLLPTAGPEVEVDARVSNVHTPTLTAYLAPERQNTGTAVIVCPGGAYRRLAIDKEGTNVAVWLNGLGVSAFVLKYRMQEYGHPAPLRDVLRAVRLLRSQAARWKIAPDRIGVMGFSAGGHLASSAGTLFDAPEGRTGADLDRVSARPDFLVLVYPVISMSAPYVHAGSRQSLLGDDASAVARRPRVDEPAGHEGHAADVPRPRRAPTRRCRPRTACSSTARSGAPAFPPNSISTRKAPTASASNRITVPFPSGRSVARSGWPCEDCSRGAPGPDATTEET